MPLETGTYVQDLDAANPAGSDDISLGDNHLRLIKSVLKTTLPNASKAFRFPSFGATKTGNFSVSFPSDQNVLFSIDSSGGAIAVSLPDPTTGATANEDGFGFWLLMSAGANAITVSPAGAQTIMGASSYTLTVIKQWAYFFWAKTAAKWFVFDSNVPSLAYALTIALSGGTPLTLRRTENDNTTEYEVISQQLGSGAGAKVSRRLFGGGANDVAQIRDYLSTTELFRWTTALALCNIAFGIGSNINFNPSGFGDLTEITAPSSPAANVARAYAVDESGTTNLAWKDSGGVISGLRTAIQADMEAASSLLRTVSPGVQHYHPGHPKFWAMATVSGGTPTLQTSYNVTSITDTATGKLTVTIATDFSSANWCAGVTVEYTAADPSGKIGGIENGSRAAGSIVARAMQTGAAANATLDDPDSWHVMGLGDQ